MNNLTVDSILEIVNKNIEGAEITAEQIEEDLSQLGMDSITFIRIVVALEEYFDIEIPDEYLLIAEMNTIEKMLKIVSSKLRFDV